MNACPGTPVLARFSYLLRLSGLGLALGASLAGSALAGESQVELTTGGLDFGPLASAAVALQTEEVLLSPKLVQIRYVLTNAGAEPLEAPFAFKFPNLDFSDPDVDYAIPSADPLNFLGVALRVDGKPMPIKLVQRATLDAKDVTGLLREAKLSLVPVGAFHAQLNAADPAWRQKLLEAGLIVESGTSVEGVPLYAPTWSVKTSFSGKVQMAPGQSVNIELKYQPSLGSSPDSVLRKALRDHSELAQDVAKRKADYCVDPPFLNGVEKMSGDEEANRAGVKETRIHVRLARGGLGPAHEYRLTVDKGAETRLVSFCANNLKSVTKTKFETRSQDFTPIEDLKILLIDGKPKPVAQPR